MGLVHAMCSNGPLPQVSFETARDTIRNELHSQSPALLPYGPRGTSVSALASAILAPQNFVAISSPECTNCEYSEASIDDRLDLCYMRKKIHQNQLVIG